MARFVQIYRRRLEVERVPRGERPTFETLLAPGEHIIGVDSHWETDLSRRKTVDHVLWVWIEWSESEEAP